jgi:hypothetical protein
MICTGAHLFCQRVLHPPQRATVLYTMGMANQSNQLSASTTNSRDMIVPMSKTSAECSLFPPGFRSSGARTFDEHSTRLKGCSLCSAKLTNNYAFNSTRSSGSQTTTKLPSSKGLPTPLSSNTGARSSTTSTWNLSLHKCRAWALDLVCELLLPFYPCLALICHVFFRSSIVIVVTITSHQADTGCPPFHPINMRSK